MKIINPVYELTEMMPEIAGVMIAGIVSRQIRFALIEHNISCAMKWFDAEEKDN
jgi:hypothetical protein